MTEPQPRQSHSSFLRELESVLISRRDDGAEGSYTVKLLDDPTLVQRKIMEEAFEVCLELQATDIDADRAAEEAADLMYHLMTGLVGAGVAWEEVEAVLRNRHALQSGGTAAGSTSGQASESASGSAGEPASGSVNESASESINGLTGTNND